MKVIKIVSIPFSSGHGGKGVKNNPPAGGRRVSIPFSSGHGGKDFFRANRACKMARCFYPFFIRSWG